MNENEEIRNNINSTESNSINFITNKRNPKINFSKIIAESKKKPSLYFYNKNQNNDNTAKSVGPLHKKKNGILYLLKAGNMQRNLGKNNLYRNLIVRRGNPRSEEKYKNKKKIKNIHLVNIDNSNQYFNSIKIK